MNTILLTSIYFIYLAEIVKSILVCVMQHHNNFITNFK